MDNRQIKRNLYSSGILAAACLVLALGSLFLQITNFALVFFFFAAIQACFFMMWRNRYKKNHFTQNNKRGRL